MGSEMCIRDSQVAIGKTGSEVTIANVAGTGNELIFANDDGTLKRAVGISVSDDSLTIANALSVGGATTLNTLTTTGAANFQGTVAVQGATLSLIHI